MGKLVNFETLVATLIGICLMTNLAGGLAGADTYLDNSVALSIGEDPGDRSGYPLTGLRDQRRGRY